MKRTLAALLLTLLAQVATAQPMSYSLFTLPGAELTIARDFTPGGQTVGYTMNANIRFQGFIRSADGSSRTIAVEGARDTLVYAASKGRVMGQVQFNYSDSGTRGFVMDADGRVSTFLAPDGIRPAVYGLNSAGTAVGSYQPDSGAELSGFVLKDGVFTPYLVPGSDDTELTAITDSGILVGNYRMPMTSQQGMPFIGFLDRKGKRTQVRFPGAFDTLVTDVNKAGVVVGYYNLPGIVGFKGFTFDGSTYTTVAPEGATNCYAWHINDKGEVVGFCYFADGSQASYVATPVTP
ncbi:MAG TPA: hypothetical protein VLA16_04385 [Ideonella sp.]|nr:hypothetical protein [Ideonella sp.]